MTKILFLFLYCIFIIILFYIIDYSINISIEKFNNKYNLAFYTCFYGSDNNSSFSIPDIPSEKYDCYYFSNNKNLLEKIKITKWIGVYDNKPVTEDSIESCMYGKYVKVVPQDFDVLQKYDYTCFLDSKLDKVSEIFVENFIDTYFIKKDFALLLRKHVFLSDNVWNEYNESMKQDRYVLQKKQYKKYINNQINNGLSENTDIHCQCGFLIRNMKHPIINELNNTWYSHIQECGIQDQISFFFVKQLFHQYIHPFEEIPFV